MVGVDRRVEQALVAADHREPHPVREPEPVGARVRTLQQAQPIQRASYRHPWPRDPVDQGDVPELAALAIAGRLVASQSRLQRTVGVEGAILHDDRDLELPGGQPERIVGEAGVELVAQQIEPGEPGLHLQAGVRHRVVVVPESRGLLVVAVAVVLHAAAPPRDQRVPVRVRAVRCAVQVHGRPGIGPVLLGGAVHPEIDGVAERIDGDRVGERHRRRCAAAGLEGGAEDAGVVAEGCRRRQIRVVGVGAGLGGERSRRRGRRQPRQVDDEPAQRR